MLWCNQTFTPKGIHAIFTTNYVLTGSRGGITIIVLINHTSLLQSHTGLIKVIIYCMCILLLIIQKARELWFPGKGLSVFKVLCDHKSYAVYSGHRLQ